MATIPMPRGDTLQERSKGKDVRISNIVAAKVSDVLAVDGMNLCIGRRRLLCLHCCADLKTKLDWSLFEDQITPSACGEHPKAE